MSESVKETIDKVMQQAGYYDHPYQVGERTFYVDDNSPFVQNRAGNNTGLNNMQRYNQETLNNTASINGQSPWQQVTGALQDMSRNYFDMRRDNTVGADDYFHCKANYEAASRGTWGEATTQIVGDAKERVDYFKNRIYKRLDYADALADFWHDKDVNEQGRRLVRNPLYSNSKDACQYQRVKDINERY